MATSTALLSRDDYRRHVLELRAAQGLPAELSAETAEQIAEVLLRRRYPAKVIAMRRRSQRCGNSGTEAA